MILKMIIKMMSAKMIRKKIMLRNMTNMLRMRKTISTRKRSTRFTRLS